MASDQLVIATESFTTSITGQEIAVVKGHTRLEASHPVVRALPQFFAPVGVTGVEQATAAPGSKRRKK